VNSFTPKFGPGDMVERVREYDFTDRVPEMARGNVFIVERCGGSAVKFEGLPELFDPRGFALVQEVAEMQASVVKVECMSPVQIPPEDVPDGIHSGLWSGYMVRFAAGDREFVMQMNMGVRTINAPCSVFVKRGEISVRMV
jgi:hypothetical protein